MNPVDRPIGYWLKHLHNLIEEGFDTALADLGVDRRQWQALNLLSAGPQTVDRLAEALAPFWHHPAAEAEQLAADLAGRGWVEQAGAGLDAGNSLDGPPALTLTPAGAALHATLAARIGEQRELILAGLTVEQYADTVRVLAAMAANLERRSAA